MGAANYGTVKLPSALLDEARREAQVQHRSVGGQVEHWAELGRALENTPGLTVGRVRQVLEGRARLETLSSADQDKIFNELGASFDAPDEAARDYYAAIGDRPGAVGTDGRGGVVRRNSAARPRKRA